MSIIKIYIFISAGEGFLDLKHKGGKMYKEYLLIKNNGRVEWFNTEKELISKTKNGNNDVLFAGKVKIEKVLSLRENKLLNV